MVLNSFYLDGEIEHEGSYAELMQQGPLEPLLEECEKEERDRRQRQEDEDSQDEDRYEDESDFDYAHDEIVAESPLIDHVRFCLLRVGLF